VVEFGEDWLMSCLNAVKPRFEGLLRQTVLVIRAHPQLAQTVRAYADCRYSVSACARQLHIHPNSARYRLDRWRTLTGWDVETFNGLTASIIALELMTDPAASSA
jgi:sugar diacid utilization regulator